MSVRRERVGASHAPGHDLANCPMSQMILLLHIAGGFTARAR